MRVLKKNITATKDWTNTVWVIKYNGEIVNFPLAFWVWDYRTEKEVVEDVYRQLKLNKVNL
jgi:hypothetical protein